MRTDIKQRKKKKKKKKKKKIHAEDEPYVDSAERSLKYLS